MISANMRLFWAGGALAAAAAALLPTSAEATTLGEMIAAVRSSNPEIEAQRSQIDGDTAQIAIVRAPARPQIQASGTFAQGTDGANVSSGFDRTFDGSLSTSLALYDGGAVHDGVAAQRFRVAGTRANASATENRVIAEAITAYVDVLRDKEIVALNEESLRLLDQDLEAGRVRFKEGDVTRTDVSQTEARQALAESRLLDARMQLAASDEEYQRLVGSKPLNLAVPPVLPVFSLDTTSIRAQAIDKDPRHAAAAADADAARTAIGVARAAARPKLGVSAGGEYHNYAQSPIGYFDQHGVGAQVGASASYVIYQGGLVSGQIAAARADANKAGFERESIDRTITAEASTALARYRASLLTITQSEKAVHFENDTLGGVQIEARGGERSVLDVLNARSELLDSQIALANARHDTYVAGIKVMTTLNMLGALEHPTPVQKN